MERHTECFLCISIFVILLPNFARPEECTKIFTASPGNLSDLFYAGEQLNVCQYFVRAPGDHLILLNITRLIGFATNSLQNCLPRLVIISASKQNNNKKLTSRTVCSYSEPLPLVVQSDANELRLIFYGSSSVNSGFSATYTFHTKQKPDIKHLCLSCRFPRDTDKTVNESEVTRLKPKGGTTSENGNSQSDENSLKRLAIFVLAIVTPVAIVCMCAILIYHCRSCIENSEMSGHSPRTPSQSDVTTVASNSPLLPGTSTFSAQQNQDLLRQQREMVCRRSPSTEKFPVSITLRDEDEPPHLRSQRLNPEINSSDHNLGREGVRGPPNRTVYDSDMYTTTTTQYPQKPKTTSPAGLVRTVHSSSSQPYGPPLISRPNVHIVDSITNKPIEIFDSDEAPPPYSSIVSHSRAAPVNNNLLNVCENRDSRCPTTARSRTERFQHNTSSPQQQQQEQQQEQNRLSTVVIQSPTPTQTSSSSSHLDAVRNGSSRE